MKYQTLLIIGLLLIGIIPSVFASNGNAVCTDNICNGKIKAIQEVQAGITPDSPLYGIERALERIRMKLTYGNEAKVNYGLLIAEERLSEIQAMIKKNNSNAIEKAQQERVKIIQEINGKSFGLKEEVRQKILLKLQSHIEHMQDIFDKVPEQAKSGIERAIFNSENLVDRIQESLANKSMAKVPNVQE